MEVQSVVFSRPPWTQKKAEAWLKKHNYKTSFYGKQADLKFPKQIRYRQQAPTKYKDYRTKKIPNDIMLIMGNP